MEAIAKKAGLRAGEEEPTATMEVEDDRKVEQKKEEEEQQKSTPNGYE